MKDQKNRTCIISGCGEPAVYKADLSVTVHLERLDEWKVDPEYGGKYHDSILGGSGEDKYIGCLCRTHGLNVQARPWGKQVKVIFNDKDFHKRKHEDYLQEEYEE